MFPRAKCDVCSSVEGEDEALSGCETDQQQDNTAFISKSMDGTLNMFYWVNPDLKEEQYAVIPSYLILIMSSLNMKMSSKCLLLLVAQIFKRVEDLVASSGAVVHHLPFCTKLEEETLDL